MKHSNIILYGLLEIFTFNLLFFIASYTLLQIDNYNNYLFNYVNSVCCYKLSFDNIYQCPI